jgi:hypothetical protein
MCEVMQQLVRTEEGEKAKCYTAADIHLQMLHGQYVLEAKRMQRLHGDICEDCLQENAAAARASHEEAA